MLDELLDGWYKNQFKSLSDTQTARFPAPQISVRGNTIPSLFQYLISALTEQIWEFKQVSISGHYDYKAIKMPKKGQASKGAAEKGGKQTCL